MQLTLPVPPSANRIWRKYRGRMVKSDEYRAWLDEAAWSVKAQRAGVETFGSNPVAVTIVSERPHAARDVDNQIKPILDSLQHAGVIDDDKHVQKVSAEWAGKGKSMTVTVEAIE
ncbi:MAG: RusA family crossover junction endodeoxyribonuclease [Pikeienuella sp.]